MGMSSHNLFTDGFTGLVGGNMVFRKRKSGKIVVAKSPKKSTVPPSEKQIAMREKFQRGTVYAKYVRSNPELYALYAAAVQDDQTPTNVAVRDSYTPPVVKSIDISNYSGSAGSRIVIVAKDDFKVNSVRVSIHSMAGELIEEGNAVIDSRGNWIYTTMILNYRAKGSVITAVATDLPENKGELTVVV